VNTVIVPISEIMEDQKHRLDARYWSAMKSDDPFSFEVTVNFDDKGLNTVYSISFIIISSSMDNYREVIQSNIADLCRNLQLKGTLNAHIKVKKYDYVFKDEKVGYEVQKDFSISEV
jgi:hypothetical protein